MDLQVLLGDRGASVTTPSTTVPSDELIESWMEDVRLACGSPEAPPTSNDFLSSVDWVYGDVDQSAKFIVQGLLSKELDVKTHASNTTVHDPTVAMEMRHKKVRERRVAREQKQAKRRARESLANEARRQARRLVQLEEARARERKKQDEQIVASHMTQFRAELREKERQARLVAMETPPINNVVAEAERLVGEERKRQGTRTELVRQLEEAETAEVKNNLKLLHSCFSRWCQVVIEGRGKMAKAAAVREWRLCARVWAAWRRWVEGCRRRRERDQAARQLQRQRILYQRACDHYRERLLTKTLRGWVNWIRWAESQRQEEQTKNVYKKKMEALLTAAAQRVTTVDPTQAGSPHDQEGSPHDQEGSPQEGLPSSPVHSTRLTTQSAVAPPTRLKPHPQPVHTPKQTPVKPPSPKVHPPHTQPSLWKKAKEEMTQLMERVETETTTKIKKRTSAKSVPDKEKRQPLKVTQPLPLCGMERRSVAMAERRAARLQRQEERERERLAAQAREEEERVRAQAEQRRAREAQQREERLAAKRREQEREDRRCYMASLQARASDHHRLALLKSRGLLPWIRFIAHMRQARELADRVRGQALVKRVFHVWRSAAGQRSTAREKAADKLHNQHLLQRAMKSWKQYVTECEQLEALAEENVTRLLTGRVFRGWWRVTRDETVRKWEMNRQARKFRERWLKSRALGRWIQFVPLSREEKAQEKRRAELRKKVASWLNDYSPNPQL